MGMSVQDHRSSVDHIRTLLCALGKKRREEVRRQGEDRHRPPGGARRRQDTQPHQVLPYSAAAPSVN